ncbi:MAG: hypothetical protein JJ902_05265 [Roseibium sp.]|nr:hypothetical protein [Roseibium sp.]
MSQDNLTLHEMQMQLGYYQRRCLMSDGNPAGEVVMVLEGEEAQRFVSLLGQIEQALRHLEILSVQERDRGRSRNRRGR